eukprot:1728590-Amphidinium_carterae.1
MAPRALLANCRSFLTPRALQLSLLAGVDHVLDTDSKNEVHRLSPVPQEVIGHFLSRNLASLRTLLESHIATISLDQQPFHHPEMLLGTTPHCTTQPNGNSTNA